MGRSEIRVVDARGEEGTLDSAPRLGTPGEVAIRLASGERMLAPVDMLTPLSGGSYRLNGAFHDLQSARPQDNDPGAVVEEQIIPVIEEAARVEKRVRETGRVRISKQVTEHFETVDEPLLREEVEIERVPIGRIVEEPTGIRHEGDLTIIPVFEERLVVQKQLILKEELHVRQHTSTRHEPREISLRRETVHVERVQLEDQPDEETR